MADAELKRDLETAVFVLRDSRGGTPERLSKNTLKKMLDAGDKNSAASDKKYKIVKVQFNPAALNFSMGTARKTDSRGDIGYSKEGKKRYADYNTVKRKGISLSIELVFDGTTQKKPDVITNADEFMYIIKNPYMRRVDFYWGKMQYSGIVESVETEFTYFTADAAPARAKVSFSMDITEDITVTGAGTNE